MTGQSQPQPGHPTTSTAVRGAIVEALRLNLVGPDNEHAFAHELLPQSPRRWYVAGFLVPSGAPEDVKVSGDDEMAEEAPEQVANADDTDDSDQQPRVSFLPSSMGLSVLVGPEAESIRATLRWGDYVWETPDESDKQAEPDEDENSRQYEEELAKGDHSATGEGKDGELPLAASSATGWKRGYRRECREEVVEIPIAGPARPRYPVPNSRGLFVEVSVRVLKDLGAAIPDGSRAVSVFLVNERDSSKHTYQTVVFQTEIELNCPQGFLGRPDLRGLKSERQADTDEWIADLHYRDALEYAVGHGVSAEPLPQEDGVCRSVRTTWIPTAEVERVEHFNPAGVELGMEALGTLSNAAEAASKLGPLVTAYRKWIKDQEDSLPGLGLSKRQLETAGDLIRGARTAADRIETGIDLLKRPEVLESFTLANRAMARAARRRQSTLLDKAPEDVDSPRWRAFQLAFILMNLAGMEDPRHPERTIVDLLFFPTGGGKTEAYLGLSAFTLLLRRLRDPGPGSAGVSIIMRYTLRLLTLDQLGRAAALMCSLEIERQAQPDRLGTWPFEIGLWVGSAATPNVMGKVGDKSSGAHRTAHHKTVAFKNNPDKHSAPIPIEECPWCGTRFTPDSFDLVPNQQAPRDLRVCCINDDCDFSSAHNRTLPIVAVDAPIYRRLPCFLIATVDKFASLPWTGRVGCLFGLVQRYDAEGFYGPCDPNRGQPLPAATLPPPDLIIQDELHLISGPLGTIAGIYEVAIEHLCCRQTDGQTIRPKIVASTATVRRADRQIRALFGRMQTAVFPPPGPNRSDSFFSVTKPISEQEPGRMYVGVAAQGRSTKVILLRAALALLSAGKARYEDAGGDKVSPNPADPYMTLLGYFNSLRELGGSRRIVEDEISARLEQYWRRRRLDPEDRLFRSRFLRSPIELTSRVETSDVANAKRKLQVPFPLPDRVDVALATNMISVGLDISRLGLMLVFGQPKTSSEYIQATSRVGRQKDKPGLVVSLLNIHRPRDRSHYERFRAYHQTFYRSVEATSVTPYSPRAMDRALAAAVVGLARHALRQLTPSLAASAISSHLTELQELVRIFGQRALNHDVEKAGTADATELEDHVVNRAQALLADWANISLKAVQESGRLQYQKFEDGVTNDALIRDFLDSDFQHLAPICRNFRANRSMRDVEPAVDIIPKPSSVGTNA